MEKPITLTIAQKTELDRLWFIYGNRGVKSTHANHRFIQVLLEEGKDARAFYKPDRELINKVDELLK